MTGCWRSAQTLADVYRRWGWGDRVWTWHEAADTRLFHPPGGDGERAGLVWIGNWGDGERTREIEDFLLRPAAEAGLRLDIYGVRYPDEALAMLAAHEARYHGWAPNARGAGDLRAGTRHRPCATSLLCDDPARHPDHPRVRGARLRHAAGLRALGRCRATVSPRHRLPGRRQWRSDDASIFERCGTTRPCVPRSSAAGLETIRARHTCAHRVDELLRSSRARRAPR